MGIEHQGKGQQNVSGITTQHRKMEPQIQQTLQNPIRSVIYIYTSGHGMAVARAQDPVAEITETGCALVYLASARAFVSAPGRGRSRSSL